MVRLIRTHDKTQVNALKCTIEVVFKFDQLLQPIFMHLNMNAISVVHSTVHIRAFMYLYRDSQQNDICSFRAVTVALTVSFKLISF